MIESASSPEFLFTARRPVESEWILGVDLGQSRDHTAFALLERRVRQELVGDGVVATGYRTATELVLKDVRRVGLGTSYLEVAKAVRATRDRFRERGRFTVVVDATGVGAAVLDLLRSELRDGLVVGVVATGGHAVTRSEGKWCVPKEDLVAAVRVLLEKGDLVAAAGMRGRAVLEEEMMGFAERGGGRDDVVMALALACWWGRR